MKASEFYITINRELEKVYKDLIKNDKNNNYKDYTKSLGKIISDKKLLKYLASTQQGRYKLATYAENLKRVNENIFTKKLQLDKEVILQHRDTKDIERPKNVRSFFIKTGRIVDDIPPLSFKEIKDMWTSTDCRNFLFEINLENTPPQVELYKQLLGTLFNLARQQYGYKDNDKLSPRQADALRESFSLVLQNMSEKDKYNDENEM